MSRHTTKPISITGVPTHHFFVVDPSTFEPVILDPDGAILVFLDRMQADAEAKLRLGGKTVAIIGMGDKNWKLFQETERYRIVEKTK